MNEETTTVEPVKPFAERLREARHETDLTIEKLADKIGYSWNAVWSWETGRRTPATGLQTFVLKFLEARVEKMRKMEGMD